MDRPEPTARFYEVLVDPTPGAWFLGVPHLNADGSWKDIWAYTRCERIVAPSPLEAGMKKSGRSLDINFAAFGIPIVASRVNDLLEEVAPGETQRVPVKIDAPGQWEVMNVLSEVDCIDHHESVIQYWPKDDAENAGKPRMVQRLVIDPDRAGRAQIFRLKGWQVAIIISAKLKSALEAANVTGLLTQSVTPYTR